MEGAEDPLALSTDLLIQPMPMVSMHMEPPVMTLEMPVPASQAALATYSLEAQHPEHSTLTTAGQVKPAEATLAFPPSAEHKVLKTYGGVEKHRQEQIKQKESSSSCGCSSGDDDCFCVSLDGSEPFGAWSSALHRRNQQHTVKQASQGQGGHNCSTCQSGIRSHTHSQCDTCGGRFKATPRLGKQDSAGCEDCGVRSLVQATVPLPALAAVTDEDPKTMFWGKADAACNTCGGRMKSKSAAACDTCGGRGSSTAKSASACDTCGSRSGVPLVSDPSGRGFRHACSGFYGIEYQNQPPSLLDSVRAEDAARGHYARHDSNDLVDVLTAPVPRGVCTCADCIGERLGLLLQTGSQRTCPPVQLTWFKPMPEPPGGCPDLELEEAIAYDRRMREVHAAQLKKRRDAELAAAAARALADPYATPTSEEIGETGEFWLPGAGAFVRLVVNSQPSSGATMEYRNGVFRMAYYDTHQRKRMQWREYLDWQLRTVSDRLNTLRYADMPAMRLEGAASPVSPQLIGFLQRREAELKRQLSEEGKVPEYWKVDGEELFEFFHRRLIPRLFPPTEYAHEQLWNRMHSRIAGALGADNADYREKLAALATIAVRNALHAGDPRLPPGRVVFLPTSVPGMAAQTRVIRRPPAAALASTPTSFGFGGFSGVLGLLSPLTIPGLPPSSSSSSSAAAALSDIPGQTWEQKVLAEHDLEMARRLTAEAPELKASSDVPGQQQQQQLQRGTRLIAIGGLRRSQDAQVFAVSPVSADSGFTYSVPVLSMYYLLDWTRPSPSQRALRSGGVSSGETEPLDRDHKTLESWRVRLDQKGKTALQQTIEPAVGYEPASVTGRIVGTAGLPGVSYPTEESHERFAHELIQTVSRVLAESEELKSHTLNALRSVSRYFSGAAQGQLPQWGLPFAIDLATSGIRLFEHAEEQQDLTYYNVFHAALRLINVRQPMIAERRSRPAAVGVADVVEPGGESKSPTPLQAQPAAAAAHSGAAGLAGSLTDKQLEQLLELFFNTPAAAERLGLAPQGVEQIKSQLPGVVKAMKREEDEQQQRGLPHAQLADRLLKLRQRLQQAGIPELLPLALTYGEGDNDVWLPTHPLMRLLDASQTSNAEFENAVVNSTTDELRVLIQSIWSASSNVRALRTLVEQWKQGIQLTTGQWLAVLYSSHRHRLIGTPTSAVPDARGWTTGVPGHVQIAWQSPRDPRDRISWDEFSTRYRASNTRADIPRRFDFDLVDFRWLVAADALFPESTRQAAVVAAGRKTAGRKKKEKKEGKAEKPRRKKKVKTELPELPSGLEEPLQQLGQPQGEPSASEPRYSILPQTDPLTNPLAQGPERRPGSYQIGETWPPTLIEFLPPVTLPTIEEKASSIPPAPAPRPFAFGGFIDQPGATVSVAEPMQLSLPGEESAAASSLSATTAAPDKPQEPALKRLRVLAPPSSVITQEPQRAEFSAILTAPAAPPAPFIEQPAVPAVPATAVPASAPARPSFMSLYSSLKRKEPPLGGVPR